MYHLCTTAIFRTIYHKRKILDIRLNIKDFSSVGVTGFEPATTRPAGVTRIGVHAFYGCTELRTVNCKPMMPPSVYSDSFPTTSPEMVINVQADALKQYQENTEWNQFYGRFLRSAAL